MKCPIDTDVDLVMTDRSGVEIDYCPTCRGVWLDRGELDKIIDRATSELSPPPAAAPAAPAAPAQPVPPPAGVAPPPMGRWDSSDRSHQYGYPRRRKSFLKEMFDF